MTGSQNISPATGAATQGMLRSLKNLEGYRISSTDGDIGKVHDFFFDDEFWIVRYLVVDTGRWLPGRKVLLAPYVLGTPDFQERKFAVNVTREQVKASPGVETDEPVSRQREIELHTHYGWPFYWSNAPALAEAPPPLPPPVPPADNPPARKGDPHLRSVREMIGYHAESVDGEVGTVDDFIANDDMWKIRYLVIATSEWLAGRKVLISPEWLVGPISWSAQKVKLIMTRASIKNSPEFDPAMPVNRDYESKLYDFYGRPRYWD